MDKKGALEVQLTALAKCAINPNMLSSVWMREPFLNVRWRCHKILAQATIQFFVIVVDKNHIDYVMGFPKKKKKVFAQITETIIIYFFFYSFPLLRACELILSHITS